MKQKSLYIAIALFLLSCSDQSEQKESVISEKKQVDSIASKATTIGTNPVDEQTIEYKEFSSDFNEIPPDGKYRFDIAFAEWQGKSMGEGVTVEIIGDSVKVIYKGDGNLTNTGKGEVMDQGLIMKHKSGNWIVGTNPEDKELDEVGGCTGGPAIIDFKNKKYWLC